MASFGHKSHGLEKKQVPEVNGEGDNATARSCQEPGERQVAEDSGVEQSSWFKPTCLANHQVHWSYI